MRGENIHGAPYDFRRAANEHSLYFARLKTLIETTYKQVRGWHCCKEVETQINSIILQNGETAVVLVTHSMGSIMTLYFLHQQTQVTVMRTVVWLAKIHQAAHWLGSLQTSVPISCLLSV